MSENNYEWVANNGEGGDPIFKTHSDYSELVMQVRCKNTGHRTMLTEEQWHTHLAALQAPRETTPVVDKQLPDEVTTDQQDNGFNSKPTDLNASDAVPDGVSGASVGLDS